MAEESGPGRRACAAIGRDYAEVGRRGGHQLDDSSPRHHHGAVRRKRPDQLRENAGALGWRLSASQLAAIDRALAARGQAVSRNAV